MMLVGAAFVETSTEAVGSAEAAETAERPETKGPIAERGSRVIKVGDISDERLRQWAERRGLESMTDCKAHATTETRSVRGESSGIRGLQSEEESA